MTVFSIFKKIHSENPEGFSERKMALWLLTKFFIVLFSKTASLVTFLKGKVYHNSSLFDWSKEKVMGPRSYTE